jgi:hypothetical protein
VIRRRADRAEGMGEAVRPITCIQAAVPSSRCI